MDFTPVLAMSTLVMTAVNALRYARARDWNGVVTQLCSWSVAVGVVMLASQTLWAAEVGVGSVTLADLDLWSQVFVGLFIGSAGSSLVEILKAVDNTQSTAKPSLLRSKPTALRSFVHQEAGVTTVASPTRLYGASDVEQLRGCE